MGNKEGVTVAVMNAMTKISLGRKGFILAYISRFTTRGVRESQVRQDPGSRN